jgi:radical SAM protein with 4Fe4S-binding SPASM domain
MDPKKKFFLFKKAQYFCSVPWNYFKINPDGTIYTCVLGKELLGNVKQQDIHEILKNPVLKEIRESLFNDQPHKNCAECNAVERKTSEHGEYKFLRDLYNNYFIKSDVDYSNSDEFVLGGVDLHWHSICNLKCITCWPFQSSAIAQEMRIPIQSTNEREVEELINWMVRQQHTLKEVYLCGGEPTLIKHNLRLLRQLDKNTDCLIRVNTNLTFSDDNPVVEEVLKFPNVLFTISADATGEQFEYIRQGADWRVFTKNIERITKTHAKSLINSVFFVASAQRLMQTQEFYRNEFGIDNFTVNQCRMEKYSLMSRNLPDHIKAITAENIREGIARYPGETNLVAQLNNCLDEIAEQPNGLDYKAYFDDIDSRRKTNWRNVFPELD